MDGSDSLLVGRVDGLEGLAFGTLDVLVVNEPIRAQQSVYLSGFLSIHKESRWHVQAQGLFHSGGGSLNRGGERHIGGLREIVWGV